MEIVFFYVAAIYYFISSPKKILNLQPKIPILFLKMFSVHTQMSV